ncbi:BgTH12-01883 [Blumeria graminis f. sp. triticale]|uniref:BgTH12-01883 n=1 Tax=Blumeria graminis f. sp. triticale TaxID=1689686 RepID=A0A9W4CZM0_BLUGR|nr:BgTH12-01883 [Blumeria graminis f. sp. triticale]
MEKAIRDPFVPLIRRIAKKVERGRRHDGKLPSYFCAPLGTDLPKSRDLDRPTSLG